MLFRPEINRTANVKAESVEPKFGDLLRGGVEVVAGIERVVAQELPSAGVILLGAGLDDGRHGRRGRQPIFSAVVRGHLPEFGDGIERRHDVGTAGAATIAALAAIEQIEVVALAHSVETHVGVAADRSRNLEIALAAGCAGRQGNQRVHAAPVGGELTELLSGDDVADFTGIGLHGDRRGLDRDLFLSAADREFEVDAGAVVDGEDDVFLLGNLESGRRGSDGVVADVKIGSDILPSLLVVRVRDRPVSMLVTVMVTLGTAAPVGSVTVPTMVASCARPCAAKENNKAARRTTKRRSKRFTNRPKLPAFVGERDFICQPPEIRLSGVVLGTGRPERP